MEEPKAEEAPDEPVTATDTVHPEQADEESDLSEIALLFGKMAG